MTPHRFQSGFVANRIARGEAPKYPNAEVTVRPVKQGKGRIFVIEKVEDSNSTFWVNPAAGFLPLSGDGDADAR